jgi:hypothetical protein
VHGVIFGPEDDPDDDIVENCRLWLADPLAVNWASRETVRSLIDEIERLRAELSFANDCLTKASGLLAGETARRCWCGR